MTSKDEIIERLTQLVEENLSNERFGVEELAVAYAVSRSTLLRTIKKHTGLSANQFIKEVRLEQASILLSESEKTIAEISFETGFSSPSYFIKCFREQYGFSPGESRQMGTQLVREEEPESTVIDEPSKYVAAKPKPAPIGRLLVIAAVVAVLMVLGYLWSRPAETTQFSGKSIAVLPFKNESADSSNVYFVNGMMESILNNLQKIEDIRVISRNSVEKYRNSQFSTPEIAEALGVDYVLEGSGQKSGEDILLTVQLIEATVDRHLWSDQYNRKLSDVFMLQAEVSKKIASEIEVVIKPQVYEQIEAAPTQNLEAYDAFLKGVEFLEGPVNANLDSAVSYFEEAIALDPQFADPYAYLGICFYHMDIFKVEKEHLTQMDAYADKALLLNNELPEAFIARGLYYVLIKQYEDAREYFEKVLEYNPNSAWTHNFLSEIYHRYLPNTEKYLVHALLTLQLDLSQEDSLSIGFSHLILSNAFAQSGMMDKAKEHIQVSLNYDSTNTFSRYVDIFIDMVSDSLSIDEAIVRMTTIYEDDTTRLDVLKELATLYYSKQDYETADLYFTKFIRTKKLFGLNLFPDEDITIAFVARELGDTARARVYRDAFESFAAENKTIYQPFLQMMVFLYDGNNLAALDAYETFIQEDDYMYWLVFLKGDPLFANVKDDPRFLEIYNRMKADFEVRRRERVLMLQELGLWR